MYTSTNIHHFIPHSNNIKLIHKYKLTNYKITCTNIQRLDCFVWIPILFRLDLFQYFMHKIEINFIMSLITNSID